MATKNNREALRQRIKELAGLTDDERAALLELVNTKKYGLVWENHPEDVEERLRTSLPVLEEVKERYIPGSTPDSPNHILIEGDNLEALTALSYTHDSKIDVIYIDPPYNTGAHNWRYNNDFIDIEDGYRHSKWLSWINRRLVIAKRLLQTDGIIVVTIDDYEIYPLKLLMDFIYGEENYLATVVIRNNPSGRSTVRGFSINHEYALYYSKSQKSKLGRLSHNEKQKSRYLERDNIGQFEWENFRKNGTDSDRKDRPKQFYPLFINKHNQNLRLPKLTWSESSKEYMLNESANDDELIIWPISPEGNEKVWKFGIERTKTILNNLLVQQRKGKYEIYRKKYLNEDGSLPHTWWDKPDYSARDNGTRTLSNIFGPIKVFDFPKAPEAVKDSLISAGLKREGIVLDFFAGSGTTMHAVMQLNKEDGGHRQCILVTNNEKNICEEVTYERNKRVINGYTTPKGVEVEGLHNNSLRYYKTKLLPRQRTNRNMHDLMNAATDLLCIKEDIYEEQTIKDLAIKNISRYVRLFSNGNRYMLVIYNEEAIPRVVPWIATSDFLPKERIKVYTFSYNNYAYDDDFAEVEDRVQLCALPAAIYEAYRRVLPKENRYYDDEPIDGKEDEA